MKINITSEQIINKINGSPKGCSSAYIKLDNNFGIKLYKLPSERNRCYERQKKASVFGLGPDTFGTIDLPEDCEYPYGYITENVEVLVPHDEVANDIWKTYHKYSDSPDFYEKVEVLTDELYQKTSVEYIDTHPNNIGIKNGKWILIDFGL